MNNKRKKINRTIEYVYGNTTYYNKHLKSVNGVVHGNYVK
jgi:hypothetical protein